MKDIRGPDVPVPDSVPEELVALYGAQARLAVRARRSRWFRRTAGIRRWAAARDLWYLTASSLLWLVIVGGVGGTIALAAIRWPGPVLNLTVLAAVAAVSSVLTVLVVGRRASSSG